MTMRFVNPQSVMTKWAFRMIGAVWLVLLLWYFILLPSIDRHERTVLGVRINNSLFGVEFDIFVAMMAAGFVSGGAAFVLAVLGWLRKEPDRYNIRAIVILLVLFSVPAFLAAFTLYFVRVFP